MENQNEKQNNLQETEVNANETEVNANETEVDANETEVNANETEVDANETEVDANETEVNANETEVNANETEVNANETEVNNSQAKDAAKEYSASNIKVLGGVEAVRQTPAMYIGDTFSSGLHHLVYEIVDNSIDEALAGICTHIVVKMHTDDSITVIDNGRGMPVDYHEKEKKSALEVITTTLHAGGKFDKNTYKVSGGLHGVGVSVVNALSQKMDVEVFRDGYIYFQSYKKGIPQSDIKKLGKTSERGTKIRFRPDDEIFEDTTFSYGVLARRLRELAFLNKKIHISLEDEKSGKKDIFYNEEGIKAFVEHLNQNKDVVHKDVICFQKEAQDDYGSNVSIEVALQYHGGYNETIYTYVNNIHTKDGGTHLAGFKAGLTRTLNNYSKKENIVKDKIVLVGEDWREGLTLILCVKVPKPQFEGQTKTKLGNREIQGLVETVFSEFFSTYLEEQPQIARNIVNKGIKAAQVRQAAKRVRDIERQRKSPLHSGGLPGKLADCSSKDINATELYLVEGDSAGGSAKTGRDRVFQAILPLKGKILNVEKARLDKILSHNEIKMIITALGTGIQNDFNIEKRRYGKIIIMTDADVDGSHIRTLLLTFFFRNMKQLIEHGYVYIAQPPLYKFKRKRKEQYIFDDQEAKRILMNFGVDETQLKWEDKIIEKDDLKKLVQTISKFKVQLAMLKRYGIKPHEFLQLRNGECKTLPILQYKYNEETGYFFSEDELDNFVKAQEEKIGQEILIQEIEKSGSNGNLNHDEVLFFRELHEVEGINKLIEIIETFHINIENYFTPLKSPYNLMVDEEIIKIYTLDKLTQKIEEIGENGLEIQRYKGLGEMNPDQLWTTTMNPETRTLFKVQMEDEENVERLFSILMGNDVAQRREFIETHALDVRELDI